MSAPAGAARGGRDRLPVDGDTFLDAALDLLAWMEARDHRGWDPYDALASPVARALSLKRRWPAVALTQLLRRTPVQVRPLLGVPRHENPKGLALTLRAHLRLGRATGDRRHEAAAAALRDRLLRARHPSGGWGYPFPWANRDFYAPAGTPSSVVTAFVGDALVDLRTAGGEVPDEALEGAGRFLAEDLRRIEGPGDTFCFSYTPGDERAVHNANVLAAALLARLSNLLHRPDWVEPARRALAFTLAAQEEDGGWPYGTTARNAWVDPYHTGFILLALVRAGKALGTGAYDEAVDRGFEFWRRAFLVGPAVGPRPGQGWPVDLHAVGQGIGTLLGLRGRWENAVDEAERLGRWALEEMRAPDGHFHYIHHGWRINRMAYMRWTQAWMLRGLAELAEVRAAERRADAR